MKKINEELLNAWLKISTSIVNSRVVSDLPYNESLVCNILYQNDLSDGVVSLTATDLCNRTNMLKSQMNRTLNLLECKGIITRERSSDDKRQIFVRLNHNNADVYMAQHRKILHLLDEIIERIGVDKAKETISTLTEIANIADNILKNK